MLPYEGIPVTISEVKSTVRVLLMSTGKSLEKTSLFDRLLDLFSYINTIITGIAMVAMTAIFGWLVFGRYVLNATPPGLNSILCC